jgi:RNA polymerase sigma factor (sigma-70 family)
VAVEEPLDLRLDVLDLDRALNELADIAPQQARVVELRFFGGLSVDETAEYLGISPATVKRHWQFARAWLYRAITGRAGGPAALDSAPRTQDP